MTTMGSDPREDAALDAAFAALRDAAPAPSPALVARVLADAAASRPGAPARAARGSAPLSWLRVWIARHAVAGGLAAAAAAGFAVGVLGPLPALLDPGAVEVALIPDVEAFALLDPEEGP